MVSFGKPDETGKFSKISLKFPEANFRCQFISEQGKQPLRKTWFLVFSFWASFWIGFLSCPSWDALGSPSWKAVFYRVLKSQTIKGFIGQNHDLEPDMEADQ